jgi:formylglycine-generating enzyme required for sulfatase activity
MQLRPGTFAATLLTAILFAALCQASEPLPTKTNSSGDAWAGNGLAMRFRWCPAGKFTMGSPASEAGRDSDEDAVEVTLSRGYWLAECETSRADWEKVIGVSWQKQREKRWQYDRIGEDPKAFAAEPDKPELPMSYVNYDEVLAFCTKLTADERKAGRLPEEWKYTLPTEAQWEFACRAGTTTPWTFGDDFDVLEKYGSYRMAVQGLLPVGTLRPNAWELCDMHGNVYELVRDGYTKKLPGGTDPFTPPAKRSSCHRGGSYRGGATPTRSAARLDMWFGRRMHDYGLRLAIVEED